MNKNFIYLRYIESVSAIQFIKLGFNGMRKPESGDNIKLDIYFDATPKELTENIQKFYITTQYTFFGINSTMFAHFNVMTPFEIATPHLSLDQNQLMELIEAHQSDCIKQTNNLTIYFPNKETVTIGQNYLPDVAKVADIFEQKLRVQRWNRDNPPE